MVAQLLMYLVSAAIKSLTGIPLDPILTSEAVGIATLLGKCSILVSMVTSVCRSDYSNCSIDISYSSCIGKEFAGFFGCKAFKNKGSQNFNF